MNRRELMLTTMTASLAGALSTPARAAARGTPAQVDSGPEAIDAIISESFAREHPAGLALSAIRGGQIIAHKVAGRASLAFDVPVASDTLFHLGSVSKHATAAAFLQLVDQGLVSLDDTLGRILPGVSASWGDRTFRQIFSHSSGLPEYHGGYAFTGFDRPITREGMFELTRKVPPLTPAGEAFFYSNAAYTLAGYAIEELTGQSYGTHMTQLFRSLGLSDGRIDDGEAFVPRRAEPCYWQNGVMRRSPQMASSTSAVAAGGLLMSARDIPAWEAGLAPGKWLSQGALDALFTPVRNSHGRSSCYGMGWRIETLDGTSRYYHHTGLVPGFRAFHLRIPDADFAMLVLSTGDFDIFALGMRIAEALCPGHTPYCLDPIRDDAPELAALVKETLLRDSPPAKERLAPELAILPTPAIDASLPKLDKAQRASARAIMLVQKTQQGPDHWRRYRLDYGTHQTHMIAAFDGEGHLAFMRVS